MLKSNAVILKHTSVTPNQLSLFIIPDDCCDWGI